QIALVSDAGMPGISDPGQKLVKRALEAGIEVEVIPGPSAFTAALAWSGLDGSSFTFIGFLPAKRSQRQAALMDLKREQRTVILYEAPHRLVKTLEDMSEIMGPEHPTTVVREITKLHQQVKQGSIGELLLYYRENPPRGEICLLIPAARRDAEPAPLAQIIQETAALIDSGVDKKEAFKMKAREYNVKKSTIYKQFLDK
ncbi:MAG: 16S rRNA (cytidine(1402)-2'-O)-methyltransferase, partial [Syntrophomonadaceae bacterium]|nr:16S rRNA (cytidine(1402)-2'-O)-methyltransferase [Syntrophomonadaceae bacterium]